VFFSQLIRHAHHRRPVERQASLGDDGGEQSTNGEVTEAALSHEVVDDRSLARAERAGDAEDAHNGTWTRDWRAPAL